MNLLTSLRAFHVESTYATFRAENRHPLIVALNFWRYLLKYLLAKKRYPKGVIDWAERASRTVQRLPRPHGATLRIGLAGDLMWVRIPGGALLDPELKQRMAECDYWIANLETPIVPDPRVRRFWPDWYRYQSGEDIVAAFSRSGRSLLGMVSLANNHVFDAGRIGITSTERVLYRYGILHSGLNGAYCIREEKGIRVGFYALAYGSNRPAPDAAFRLNEYHCSRDGLRHVAGVMAAMRREGAELTILSLHWGHEFEFFPTPLQRRFARALARCGADIICGHHPHVIQPIEVLFLGGYEKNLKFPVGREFCIPAAKSRKTLVIYSLGNLVSDMVTLATQVGLGVDVSISKREGRVDWDLTGVLRFRNRISGISRPHRTLLLEQRSPGYGQ